MTGPRTTLRGRACDCGCGRNAVKCFRLNPANLHERFGMYAPGCATKHGFTKVDYSRPAREGTWVSGRTRGET